MTETTLPTQSARRTLTRSRLMDAAFDVFAENGFGGASLELICDRAGLTRGAFYYNFSSKEELFLAVMEREFDGTLEILVDQDSAKRELGQVLDLVLAVYSSRAHGYVAWATLTEEFRLHAMRDPDAAAAYTAQFRAIHERLGAAIERVAGEHGKRLASAPATVAAIVTSIFIQAVNEGILARLGEKEIQRMAADRILITLEGLLPPARS